MIRGSCMGETNRESGALIEIRGVGKHFPAAGGYFEALKDVNAVIPEGRFAILKGRSGSGKTTLLNIVGALDLPTSGQVLIGGRDIAALSEHERDNLRRGQMGFVFQAVSLMPSLTAWQNVEFSLRLAGVRKGRKERVDHCLSLVGLANRANHMPAELSGGEQQRVAIARAIAHRPRILLADEPTAELDSAMAAHITQLLRELTRKEGITILMTTHDTGLMDAGDLIIELENGRQVGVTVKDAAKEPPNMESRTDETGKPQADETAADETGERSEPPKGGASHV